MILSRASESRIIRANASYPEQWIVIARLNYPTVGEGARGRAGRERERERERGRKAERVEVSSEMSPGTLTQTPAENCRSDDRLH